MKKTWTRIRTAADWPWHPFLIAVWFMFFPYAHNRNDLTPNVTIAPIKIALLVSLLAYLLCWIAYRSHRRAGLIATALVTGLLGYGYIADFLHKPHISVVSTGGVLLPALILVIAYFAIRTWKLKEQSEKIRKISYALNIAGLFLVLVNVLPVALSGSRNIGSESSNRQSASDLSKAKVNLSKAPDIYYIVPEDYASNSTLASSFGYDNSSYTNFLKAKGFVASGNASPNYPYSPPSLASTLNMRYLDAEAKKYGSKTTSVVPFYNLLTDSQVVKDLKSVGYEYVHIGSWWGPTEKSPLADVQFSTPTKFVVFGHTYDPSEFDQSLMNASIGRLLVSHPVTLGKKTIFKSESTQLSNKAQTFFNQFSYLRRIVKSVQSPKFVFMHVLAPHRPFVLDKSCAATAERYGTTISFFKNSYTKDYVDELQCVNKQLENAVSYIQANSPRPPVIIIQSDEGEYPLEYWQGELSKNPYDWYNAPTNLLKYKVQTQAAFYLPGVKDFNINQDAFVNTFRYIFDKYLGANLPQLPQKNYISDEHTTPYVFKDITGKLSN